MRVFSISYRIPRLLIRFWRHEHRPIIFSRRGKWKRGTVDAAMTAPSKSSTFSRFPRFLRSLPMSSKWMKRLKRSAEVTHVAQSSGMFSSVLASSGLDRMVYLSDLRVRAKEGSED